MSKDQLKSIFLSGWITSYVIKNHTNDFIILWEEEARFLEEMGFQLVVFKIPIKPPHKADPEAIEEIERLLQQKYPHHANQEHTQTPRQD